MCDSYYKVVKIDNSIIRKYIDDSINDIIGISFDFENEKCLFRNSNILRLQNCVLNL